MEFKKIYIVTATKRSTTHNCHKVGELYVTYYNGNKDCGYFYPLVSNSGVGGIAKGDCKIISEHIIVDIPEDSEPTKVTAEFKKKQKTLDQYIEDYFDLENIPTPQYERMHSLLWHKVHYCYKLGLLKYICDYNNINLPKFLYYFSVGSEKYVVEYEELHNVIGKELLDSVL